MPEYLFLLNSSCRFIVTYYSKKVKACNFSFNMVKSEYIQRMFLSEPVLSITKIKFSEERP